MAIRVYNTMSRSKEELETIEPGTVKMYVCGPTVYNYIHLGNARTFLNFDMIRRYLEYSGVDVTFVQNITDVDDKIINRANVEGVPADEIAEKYRLAFEEDMEALGVKPPDIAPRATEHIAEMVEVIAVLVEKGHAYVADGDVYFDVSSFAGYGRLSGRDLSEQQVTVQFSPEMERKRDPWDFALWKAAKPGEPSWESPWGPGRPGWHIECSTMSVQYLGGGFDIHGGGLDLVFPHHENEMAQAEAYSGDRFARYWIHSGMLNIDQEKMSKSLGNIKMLREVLEEFDPDTVRMLMLGTHYRSPLSFSEMSLTEARASIERIWNCLERIESAGDNGGGGSGAGGNELTSTLERLDASFREHMDDDFNSAAALGEIFEAVREVNTFLDGAEAPPAAALQRAKQFIMEHCGALGLELEASSRIVASSTSRAKISSAGSDRGRLLSFAAEAGIEAETGEMPDEELVQLLLEARQVARESKDFTRADMIRDGLNGLGIQVEDIKRLRPE
jgi:cysteinyl-tRNA synthetase